MTIVLLADGFEEIEALTPVDMLRRAGLAVKTVGISGKTVTGAHGISVVTDLMPDEVDLSSVDTLILPGGMPGTLNLDESPFTDKAIKAVLEKGGRLAAICAAPIILGRRGLLKGVTATCYPGFENELIGAQITDISVVTSGNITTARGMGVALEFAEELIALSIGDEKAEEISRAICKETNSEDLILSEEDGVEDIEYCDDDVDEDCAYEKADPDFSGYTRPSSDLLSEDKPSSPDYNETEKIAEIITATLAGGKVNIDITGVEHGPRVTRFTLIPSGSTPVKKIIGLQPELSLALGVAQVRIIAPIPGQRAINIEVPNKKADIVSLRGVLESEEYKSDAGITSVALGRSVGGKPVIADIIKMPHLIVAGATGMGKSVAIESILVNLLLKADPDQLKLIMVDPKQVEFNAYDGLPHLIYPIIYEPKIAAAALSWAVEEMERRYGLLAASGTRNIVSYNKLADENSSAQEKLPFIVIVIDELADLMLAARDLVETPIMRLAQKARAAGIHLIMGTQRPSNDVITPIIRANIPSRLCFKVMCAADSRAVLDMNGAEQLLDRGDALYIPAGAFNPTRIQCAYISASEAQRVADAAKSIGKGVGYDPEITEYIKNYLFRLNNPILFDKQFLDAVDVALSTEKISTALIQRSLSIGYGKAAKFIDMMEELGIVSEMNGQRPREVLMTREDWQLKLSKLQKCKK